jgi:hypothetical protein
VSQQRQPETLRPSGGCRAFISLGEATATFRTRPGNSTFGPYKHSDAPFRAARRPHPVTCQPATPPDLMGFVLGQHTNPGRRAHHRGRRCTMRVRRLEPDHLPTSSLPRRARNADPDPDTLAYDRSPGTNQRLAGSIPRCKDEPTDPNTVWPGRPSRDMHDSCSNAPQELKLAYKTDSSSWRPRDRSRPAHTSICGACPSTNEKPEMPSEHTTRTCKASQREGRQEMREVMRKRGNLPPGGARCTFSFPSCVQQPFLHRIEALLGHIHYPPVRTDGDT